MIAHCGLDCEKCDAFLATRADDDGLRAKTAAKWSAMYGASIRPEQINCSGCRLKGVKFFYCESMCNIRKCASAKGHATCADCADYACEQLNFVLKAAPQARENLEALRAGGRAEGRP
jgi:hypothetical protein